MPTGTRLPKELPSDRFRDTAISAYRLCLELEEKLEKEEKAGKDVKQELVYCRIVGHLFHHAPGNQGVKTVTGEVLSCGRDYDKLLSVGQKYYDHFLRSFQSLKSQTPEPSSHSSFDALAEDTKATLPTRSKAKIDSLIRDRYRCVVTDAYNSQALKYFPNINEEIMSGRSMCMKTECAHIIGGSTSMGFTQTNKNEFATSVWSVLTRFGYEQICTELNGDHIHRLENVMTLSTTIKELFDTLDFWFVATGEPHKYKLKATYSAYLRGYSEYVTFTTPDAEKYPLPSPDYLSIHAACCEVTHLSGAAEYIEKYFEDMEMTRVLSTDGSSAVFLEEALRKLSKVAN